MTLRHTLAASVSALLLTGISAQAFAQSAIKTVTDEIFVTATKKSDAENVQDVPISITAFNEDTLDALKVRDLQSLTFSAPNVSLDDIGTARGTANFSIRGLGVNSSIPSIDPAVGVFVDGVYLGLNTGVVFDLFDLDSVEVLRGPQGLLFGRNTTGGAVLINTANPTDEFEYKFRFAAESALDDDRGGNNYYAQGVISGPIVEDKLNAKLGFYLNEDDGYFENRATNADFGEARTTIIRGALEWFAAPELTFLGKVDVFNSDGQGPAAQNRGLFERDSFDFSIDNEGFYDQEAITASFRTDWDIGFGDGTITNILGYRELDGITSGDIDATPLFLFHSNTNLEQEQISNELRYNGTFGKADVTTGVYYFNQDVAYTETRDIPPSSAATFYGGGAQRHQVLGVFGQIDYNITDQLIVSAGLRYADEEKDANITYIRPRAECSVVQNTCPNSGTNSFIPGENNGFTDSDSWSNFTPKFGLQYFVNDDLQVYGSYTKGFRSGGYNFRITSPAGFEANFPANEPRSFDEEEVNAFEVGTKFQSADRRIQVNAAAFYTDIADMQRELNIAADNQVVQTIINTADATLLGVELDGKFVVSDQLLLTGNVGFIDASYDEVIFDISGDGLVNDADLDLEIPRVPEITYGAGFVFETPLGDSAGDIVARANYQYRDKFAYTDNNFGFIQSANIIDANIAWNTPIEGVSLSLYGKNLLDEVQAGGDTQVPFGGAQSPAIPGSQNLANGINAPFDNNPATGTFSPLKKGKIFGIELTIKG